MKKYSLIIVAAFSLLACNVSVSTDKNKEAETETEAVVQSDKGEKTLAKKTDPVCGMEKDNTWTEFSVTNSDTTWFCSPHCKESFDKDPAKYGNKKTEEKKG